MAKDKIAKAFLAITKDKFTIDTISELHEYEKSQNIQSDSEIMNLNVLQPPAIPLEVGEYAKEYNLI